MLQDADLNVGPGGWHPAIIAHRGSSATRPEHTWGAFQQAIADGADAIECDVRMTLDGHLVCVHDRAVDRASDGRGLVGRHTLAQLRALDWSRAGSASPTQGVPMAGDADRALVTLAELIELVRAAPRSVGLVVETKHPTRDGARVDAEVARVLTAGGLGGAAGPRWGGSVAPATVLSFWPASLRRLAIQLPQVPRGQVIAAAAQGGVRRPLAAGATIAALSLSLVRRRPELVSLHHARGHLVYVWTVNEPDDLQWCRALRVDAVITDGPATALAGFDGGG